MEAKRVKSNYNKKKNIKKASYLAQAVDKVGFSNRLCQQPFILPTKV